MKFFRQMLARDERAAGRDREVDPAELEQLGRLDRDLDEDVWPAEDADETDFAEDAPDMGEDAAAEPDDWPDAAPEWEDAEPDAADEPDPADEPVAGEAPDGDDERTVPIWELMLDEAEPGDPEAAEDTGGHDMPAAAQPEIRLAAEGGAGAGGGRAKTRLLGFHRAEEAGGDIFARPHEAAGDPSGHLPVGWLVVIAGPGRGASFTLSQGVSKIGRGEDQTVRLDFGDSSISRDNHAVVAYDEERNGFFVGHGGKANLVRPNGRPVLATEELSNGDWIRIGETTLRFVAFCCSEFAWDLTDESEASLG